MTPLEYLKTMTPLEYLKSIRFGLGVLKSIRDYFRSEPKVEQKIPPKEVLSKNRKRKLSKERSWFWGAYSSRETFEKEDNLYK